MLSSMLPPHLRRGPLIRRLMPPVGAADRRAMALRVRLGMGLGRREVLRLLHPCHLLPLPLALHADDRGGEHVNGVLHARHVPTERLDVLVLGLQLRRQHGLADDAPQRVLELRQPLVHHVIGALALVITLIARTAAAALGLAPWVAAQVLLTRPVGVARPRVAESPHIHPYTTVDPSAMLFVS